MKGTSKFQIIVIAIFAVAVVGAVVIFATTKARNVSTGTTPVSVWGVLDAYSFSQTVNAVNNVIPKASDHLSVTYTQKDTDTIHTELLEAIADGTAPDIVVLPSDYIVKYLNRISPMPYQVFTERQFSDSFVEGTEIYKVPEGITAMPFSIDPLVMYWNRDIFTDAGVSTPPTTWEEFPDLAKKLTQKDNTLRIEQSFASLGEYNNVDHAKDILSLLALQSGETITSLTEDNTIVPNINPDVFDNVLSFYVSFSDPSRDTYSWNRSLPSSKDYFLLGKLGIYIGYASEAKELREKNPNLNFDVSLLPQFKNQSRKITSGKMYGLAVLKSSQNVNGALQSVLSLTSSTAEKEWSDLTGMPPVRRDLLVDRPTDRFGSILYDSSLWARSWLDLDPPATDEVFSNLIDSITSGKQSVSKALDRAISELGSIVGI